MKYLYLYFDGQRKLLKRFKTDQGYTIFINKQINLFVSLYSGTVKADYYAEQVTFGGPAQMWVQASPLFFQGVWGLLTCLSTTLSVHRTSIYITSFKVLGGRYKFLTHANRELNRSILQTTTPIRSPP